MAAMSHGKHVYVQKPLATTVRETRMLAATAREKRLVSQMGIQISSHPTQLATEQMIRERRHRQGQRGPHLLRQDVGRHVADPGGSDPVPATLDWDLWLGVSEKRPFKKDVYHPGNWRKRVGFGTGTLGDMGCHIFSTPIRGVNLYLPTSVTSYGPGRGLRQLADRREDQARLPGHVADRRQHARLLVVRRRDAAAAGRRRRRRRQACRDRAR